MMSRDSYLQTNITTRKSRQNTYFFVIYSIIIVLCSLLTAACANPLITQIAEPKTVVFITNGGSSINAQTVYRNYPIKRPQDPKKSGFIFDNWYLQSIRQDVTSVYSGSDTPEQPWDFNTIPKTDITLHANWIPIYDVTVTFDINGGDIEADPSSITAVYGSLINAPAPPKKDGFGFAGWYREPECVTEWIFSIDIVTEDLTLYAWWIHNCVTVIMNIDEIISDQSPQIDAITISRTGANGLPIFSLIKIDPNQFDAGSITWRISGVGAYAGTFITDDNDPATGVGEFLLNANDARYNAFGTHTLLLEVKKDGIAYQTNIIFTIVN